MKKQSKAQQLEPKLINKPFMSVISLLLTIKLSQFLLFLTPKKWSLQKLYL